MACLENGFDAATHFYAFPREHWHRIRSTNGLERLHGEIKRRTRAVGAFPDRASALRLVTAVALQATAIRTDRRSWICRWRKRTRSRLHLMLKSADKALEMLRGRGVITLVPAGHVPSLVQEICGGPVRGSWWAHSQSHLIYAIASALEDSPGVLTLKLLDGKVTFVHRSLWAALVRFATDRHRRNALIAALRPPESRLLAEVERRGELHFGGGAPPAASIKTALERRWLCISTSEHTASGHHATVLRSWRHWADPELLRAARTLTFESARRRLVAACGELGDADPATEAARKGRTGSGKRTLTVTIEGGTAAARKRNNRGASPRG